MLSTLRRKNRAFSLVELVIVVVIIGIIAAIAIPRMSRGAVGANDSALASNLAMLRKAIDLYYAEHDAYPSSTPATFVNQLTLYSNAAGATNAGGGASYPYGPYLRAIPPVTVGTRKGSNGIGAIDAAGVGWIYDATTGKVTANATGADLSGKNYTDY